MIRYLVVSDEIDTVVAEGADLRETVERATDRGYLSGYITNQDGGYADLAEWLNENGIHVFEGPTTPGWLSGEPSRPCKVGGCRVREFYVEDEEGE